MTSLYGPTVSFVENINIELFDDSGPIVEIERVKWDGGDEEECPTYSITRKYNNPTRASLHRLVDAVWNTRLREVMECPFCHAIMTMGEFNDHACPEYMP